MKFIVRDRDDFNKLSVLCDDEESETVYNPLIIFYETFSALDDQRNTFLLGFYL